MVQGQTGVKQGDVMSGFIFLIVVDRIMRDTTEGNKTGIRWNFTSKLEDLEFAYDIALMSSCYTHMQREREEGGRGEVGREGGKEGEGDRERGRERERRARVHQPLKQSWIKHGCKRGCKSKYSCLVNNIPCTEVCGCVRFNCSNTARIDEQIGSTGDDDV